MLGNTGKIYIYKKKVDKKIIMINGESLTLFIPNMHINSFHPQPCTQLLHMDREQLREVIYKEIMEFHQPRTPTLSFLACLRPAPKAGETCEGSGDGEPATAASFKDHLQAMMSSLSAAADKTGKDGGDQQVGSGRMGREG